MGKKKGRKIVSAEEDINRKAFIVQAVRDEHKTQAWVAEQLGISQPHVSRLLAEVDQELRDSYLIPRAEAQVTRLRQVEATMQKAEQAF